MKYKNTSNLITRKSSSSLAVSCLTSFSVFILKNWTQAWPTCFQTTASLKNVWFSFTPNKFWRGLLSCMRRRSSTWTWSAPISWRIARTPCNWSSCAILEVPGSSRKEATKYQQVSPVCRARLWAVCSGWHRRSSLRKVQAARVTFGRSAAPLSRCWSAGVLGGTGSTTRICTWLKRSSSRSCP